MLIEKHIPTEKKAHLLIEASQKNYTNKHLLIFYERSPSTVKKSSVVV